MKFIIDLQCCEFRRLKRLFCQIKNTIINQNIEILLLFINKFVKFSHFFAICGRPVALFGKSSHSPDVTINLLEQDN